MAGGQRERCRARARALTEEARARTPYLLIDGLCVESEGSGTIALHNPATSEPLGRTPAAHAKDMDQAVASSEQAFGQKWRVMPANARTKILWDAAAELHRQAEDFAILETLETGKTLRETSAREVPESIEILRYFAGWAGKHAGEYHPFSPHTLGFVEHAPHPVIAVVGSWREPLASAVKKIAPALALGCSVILVPAERAPLTSLRLGQLFLDVGLPPGVLNVVPGVHERAAETLALHPQVRALSFSGTIENARRMMLGSAKSNLKSLEFALGGKAAAVLFEDGSIQKAVNAVCTSILTARCVQNVASARLLVQRSVYEEVAATIAARAKEIVLGDPLDEHTELGPMISSERMKTVLQYVQLGRREGAKLVAGGSRDVGGNRAQGFFVLPTVFVDVRPEMRIAREEIAGPVLCIMPFSTTEEAINIINQTDYGLATSVWTKDLSRAHRLVRACESGIVWVNRHDAFDPALPLGGTRLSGRGRDLGSRALEHFSYPKSVYFDTQ